MRGMRTEGFRAAAGDVVVTLKSADGSDDVGMGPAMGADGACVDEEQCAVVALPQASARSLRPIGRLFVLAGMGCAGNVESRFRVRAGVYRLAAASNRSHADDRGHRADGVKGEFAGEYAPRGEVRGCRRMWQSHGIAAQACGGWDSTPQSPAARVGPSGGVMIAAALLEIRLSAGQVALTGGDIANIAHIARIRRLRLHDRRPARVRQPHARRTPSSPSCCSTRCCGWTTGAPPFDRTLLSTGLLGLMAGAIIAMNRNNVARYFAVMALALVLAWLSPDFLMLLPALALWIIAAGYSMSLAPLAGARARGFLVLAVGEIGLFIFGLACILEEARATPSAEMLFQQIVGLLDFPLIVLGIVAVGLGWRKGPRGTTPPHFAGVLALLVGLLTMLLNNFGAGELSRPGADQTVLLICMLYVVFALHGPRQLRWVIPWASPL